jgi:hypothetical protein
VIDTTIISRIVCVDDDECPDNESNTSKYKGEHKKEEIGDRRCLCVYWDMVSRDDHFVLFSLCPRRYTDEKSLL